MIFTSWESYQPSHTYSKSPPPLKPEQLSLTYHAKPWRLWYISIIFRKGRTSAIPTIAISTHVRLGNPEIISMSHHIGLTRLSICQSHPHWRQNCPCALRQSVSLPLICLLKYSSTFQSSLTTTTVFSLIPTALAFWHFSLFSRQFFLLHFDLSSSSLTRFKSPSPSLSFFCCPPFSSPTVCCCHPSLPCLHFGCDQTSGSC